ncbi:MAG: DEAD/DEAH box helicase family protein [bacterium]
MFDKPFKLFPFQEEAATKLLSASLAWIGQAAKFGHPRFGSAIIPFLGQLKAVTGSGKTPILAKVVSGLGNGVVLWTSRSSAVVEQTYNNLRGKYRELLPRKDIEVIRDIPGHAAWRKLIDSKAGLTIWLLTVASWNEAESAAGSGSAEARLNLHRIHPDWSGERSPWDQIRNDLQRPIWVVSDESHNQSSVQLDQLVDLRPKGFFMASATPLQTDLFRKWADTLTNDPTWQDLYKQSLVSVPTREVVEAELLKTTIEFIDFNSGTEESLDGVLNAMGQLDQAVKKERVGINPRAIYVVQQSNVPRGSIEEARPVIIWRYLRSKKVPNEEIAIYTDTKFLPPDAQKISSLSQLRPHHKHIIFNQTLQEGWDDPEAYVCYFDGVTKSFIRIRQIVGRILRQPEARHHVGERLNTATIILKTPAASYETVVEELKTELRLYAPADEPDFVPIKVKTRKDPLPAISFRAKLTKKISLPRYAVKAPDMTDPIKYIKSESSRAWAAEDLDAPGLGHLKVISLENEKKEREELLEVIRSARSENGIFLRRAIQQRNRSCCNALHPDFFNGSAFQQHSCQGSTAQKKLLELAEGIVSYYEDHAEYEYDPDPEKVIWKVGEHRPRNSDLIKFKHSAHPSYSKGDFNKDELEFAISLDRINIGLWLRNPPTPGLGYSIPLTAKLGDSSAFYPDFLWWVGPTCWAIDTTGAYLLNGKIRGKLLALDNPRVALAVRGKFNIKKETVEGDTGWSLVTARPYLSPNVEYDDNLQSLLLKFSKKGSSKGSQSISNPKKSKKIGKGRRRA